jgi:hypothetical protein
MVEEQDDIRERRRRTAMWTPLQMEMLGELKADPDRRLPDAGRVRQVRATKRRRLQAISTAAAITLRRTADRLDPAPARPARTSGWASG